jgi:hypothetical protein
MVIRSPQGHGLGSDEREWAEADLAGRQAPNDSGGQDGRNVVPVGNGGGFQAQQQISGDAAGQAANHTSE